MTKTDTDSPFMTRWAARPDAEIAEQDAADTALFDPYAGDPRYDSDFWED